MVTNNPSVEYGNNPSYFIKHKESFDWQNEINLPGRAQMCGISHDMYDTAVGWSS
jgi:hypothetical protein